MSKLSKRKNQARPKVRNERPVPNDWKLVLAGKVLDLAVEVVRALRSPSALVILTLLTGDLSLTTSG